MDRHSLIGVDAPKGLIPMGYSVVRDEEKEAPSPMCGPAVLTKLIRKKESAASPNYYKRTRENISFANTFPLSFLPSRSSYEEMSDRSPKYEDTASSSGSERSTDFASPPPTQILQFQTTAKDFVDNNNKERRKGGRGKKSTTLNRQRASSWSTTLPAVTEETSFDESQAGASIENNNDSSNSSMHLEPPTKENSPEKMEMLVAMHNLILKQQDALKEMAHQNTHYRKKLGEYQSKLIAMKQDAVTQQSLIDQLILEKETSQAESLRLHEQLKADREGKDVDEDDAEDNNKDESDDSLCMQVTDLMKLYAESPSSPSRRSSLDKSPPIPSLNREERSREKAMIATIKMGNNDCREETECRDEVTTSNGVREDNGQDENSNDQFRDTTSGFPSKYRSVSSESSFSLSPPYSNRNRNAAKEQVACFKYRLETIQKKRSDRRIDQKQTSKPIVRLGSPIGSSHY
jgi:hypothetical protein